MINWLRMFPAQVLFDTVSIAQGIPARYWGDARAGVIFGLKNSGFEMPREFLNMKYLKILLIGGVLDEVISRSLLTV